MPVRIESLEVEVGAIEIPSYPGEPRPTSAVTLRGNGEAGHGEHVGWTARAHEEFRDRARLVPTGGRTSVGAISNELPRLLPDAYDRAAVEAAVIDLALRQANHNLGSLIGAAPRDTSYVLSFTPTGDPVSELRHQLAATSDIRAKIDVDPAWAPDTFVRLAETDRVAVLDWKRTGTPEQHARAHRALPKALLEDPGPEPCSGTSEIAARRSLDGPFLNAAALTALPTPYAANVKPARMGGVLEALDGVAFCARAGIRVYFGGMFELAAGRRQLLALASLLSPDGPNDIAPIARTPSGLPRPSRLVPPKGPGFGEKPD
ncbi:MAG: hypothetical protein P8R42_21485 [Candidatus Binatia bacterium]|nr:hypothetical protein [Candidatus Binatia bacterium]